MEKKDIMELIQIAPDLMEVGESFLKEIDENLEKTMKPLWEIGKKIFIEGYAPFCAEYYSTLHEALKKKGFSHDESFKLLLNHKMAWEDIANEIGSIPKSTND